MVAFVAATVAALLGLLGAEAAGSRAGVWIAKPLASTGFVAAALAAGALQTAYGRLILLGLLLSWLGDLLLIPRDRKFFRAGVLSFLLGHVAFAVAFLARGVNVRYAVAAACLVAVAAAVVVRWLRPHLPGDMRAAAHAYVIVISVMVIAAIGTFGAWGNAFIAAGAVAFYLSDLSVARDRFVAHELVNRLWGLPLYYVAQLLLAYSTKSA